MCVRNRFVKRTLLEELYLDNPGGRVADMGDGRGELLSKSCCYFFVPSEGFGEKCGGLIERGFGTFAIEGKRAVVIFSSIRILYIC